MGKRWVKKKKKSDHYYKKAKKEKYRSRASYKLKQLNRKFKVIGKGNRVIELGAAPGGWTQVASEVVGPRGRVLGVDLARMKPLDKGNVFILKGDFTTGETLEEMKERMEECDAVISDASPDISGVWDVDHFRSVDLCYRALEVCREFLRPGGNFLGKVFQGEAIEELRGEFKKHFGYVKLSKPKASRGRSSEIYIIGKGFRGKY